MVARGTGDSALQRRDASGADGGRAPTRLAAGLVLVALVTFIAGSASPWCSRAEVRQSDGKPARGRSQRRPRAAQPAERGSRPTRHAAQSGAASQPGAGRKAAHQARRALLVARRRRAAAGQAPAQTGGAPFPDINGIRCDALESTIVHIHVHLAVFFDSEEQQIPLGIGIGQPWQVSDSDEGPFVDDGACFYWMHTHTEDGIIHIESPVRRPFTLGDFFAVWQQPLSATQVGPKTGQVIVYVNGQRDSTSPENIRLLAHQRIQLDVGADIPPYQFDFPDGD